MVMNEYDLYLAKACDEYYGDEIILDGDYVIYNDIPKDKYALYRDENEYVVSCDYAGKNVVIVSADPAELIGWYAEECSDAPLRIEVESRYRAEENSLDKAGTYSHEVVRERIETVEDWKYYDYVSWEEAYEDIA